MSSTISEPDRRVNSGRLQTVHRTPPRRQSPQLKTNRGQDGRATSGRLAIMSIAKLSSLVVVSLTLTWIAAAPAPISSPSDIRKAADAYRAEREKEILEEFIALLALPNVADDLEDMRRNADHITELLQARGFATRRLEAGGAPYLYAELPADGATETILIYAHFDGQPVQEENWAYPPFSPTLLDAPLQAGGRPVDWSKHEGPVNPEWRLYARSAGDDKMPIVGVLRALDALRANGLSPSVNLKLLLDGEEEQGSPTVGRILDENRELLRSDLLLFCDGPRHQSGRVQLVFGVRGDMGVDITAYGPTRPLHSGHYGNWAPNPIAQLVHLMASMRDPAGRPTIEGYGDDALPLGDQEREAIAAMPDLTRQLQDELSVHTPEGDGLRLEELIARSALNFRGFVAGGVGAKGRNIILSKATASLDLRLVPEQRPEKVRELIESHVAAQGFHIVHEEPTPETLRSHPKVAKLDWGTGYPGYRTRLDHPVAQRLAATLRAAAPDLILTPSMGGSLPLSEFAARLKAPIVILPLANHDNNQHAENENLRIGNLWDAIGIYAAVLGTYGRGASFGK